MLQKQLARYYLLFLLVLCSLALAEVPRQITGFNFDCDDNILFLPTKIWLRNKTTGEEKGVSTTDFADVRTKLGGEGDWKEWEVGPKSMRDFSGSLNFLNDMRKILADKSEKWKGPAFDAFIHALSDPQTAKETSLITARQHSPKTFVAGIKLLQAYMWKVHQKKIYLPDEKNIFPVGWKKLDPKYKKGGNGNVSADPSAVKANVMLDLLSEIEKVPLPENAFETLNADGTKKEKLHLWGFSDDDIGNFNKAVEVLSKAVKEGKFKNIKIVVFFTGTNVPGTPPHSVVIKSDGTTRATMEGEAKYTHPVTGDSQTAHQIQNLIGRCQGATN